MDHSRNTHRRAPGDRRKKDLAVEERLKALAAENSKWGCPQLHEQLRREGFVINHKRTERLYSEMNLKLRRRRRHRLPVGVRQVLLQPIRPAQCWSIDFMSDSLSRGKPYRLLNVIDDYARDALAIEVDFSLGAERVKRVLEQLCDLHGIPEFIRSDNGPEIRADSIQQWAKDQGITWEFIQPGKPAQNAFVERFNGTLRGELLDMHSFRTLEEARAETQRWMRIYNEKRTHRSLGKLPPSEFKARWQRQQSPSTTGIA
jgi:putative transposase